MSGRGTSLNPICLTFTRACFLAFLWLVPLVLAVWIGRVWLLAHRGLMSDDPVSFALRDKASLGLGVLVALGFVLAL